MSKHIAKTEITIKDLEVRESEEAIKVSCRF